MDSAERTTLRQALMTSALTRRGDTEDTGDGAYIERWKHPDGTTVAISWSPRDPSQTSPDVIVAPPHCSDCEEPIVGRAFPRGRATLCGHCAHCPDGSDCADPACYFAGPVPRIG